jgi:hypothetical protein
MENSKSGGSKDTRGPQQLNKWWDPDPGDPLYKLRLCILLISLCPCNVGKLTLSVLRAIDPVSLIVCHRCLHRGSFWSSGALVYNVIINKVSSIISTKPCILFQLTLFWMPSIRDAKAVNKLK